MKRFSLLVVMAAVLISTTAAAGWMRTYGGDGVDGGYCVQQTTDGGYILTGRTRSFGAGESDLWLLKTDSLGGVLWERSYGGEWYDEGHCVQVTPDGGYIVTGYTSSLEEYGHDLWLLKVDDQGDTLWTAAFDDVEGGASEGFVVREKEDGDYMISGVWEIMPMRFALGLFLADEDGYIHPMPQIWVDYDGWYNSMAIASDGCVILASNPEDKAVLIKTGVPRWERIYEGEGHAYGNCVQATSDGGYIIVGSTHPSGVEERDLWLIKTDSLGYVEGVVEDRVVEAPNWKLVTSIGPEIVLRYTDHAEGFAASFAVFDATGCKVEKLHDSGSSGTITWPVTHHDFSPGVYFFRLESGAAHKTQKVILIR